MGALRMLSVPIFSGPVSRQYRQILITFTYMTIMHPFNLQALAGYSPSSIFAHTGTTPVDFYRNARGQYRCFAGALRKSLQMTPGVGDGPWTLWEVYKIIDYHGGVIHMPTWAGDEEGMHDFVKAQSEFFMGQALTVEGQRATIELEALVSPLLNDLSKTQLQGFKVRSLESPLRCHAVSKGPPGVFIWPSWRSTREVNVRMRVKPDVRRLVRGKIQAWLETHGLHVAIPE